MKTHFVGIDIAKSTLDWHIHDVGAFGQVKNTMNGMEKILKGLREADVDPQACFFCFEHTGTYGLLLCSFMEHRKLTYTMVPAAQIQRSTGISRGKNDTIDAKRIAKYAYVFREDLIPYQLPSKVILKAKHLFTHRQQLVKMSGQLKNSLKGLKASDGIIDVSTIRSAKEAHLKLIQRQKRQVEKQIKDTLESDPEIKENLKLVQSVKGIGPMIATTMVIITANFAQFDNARQFNCYAGLAPFEHTSGTSLRGPTRVSNLANKQIKTLLHSGAKSAQQHDPELRAYTQRKLHENKNKTSITNAVACKLVARAFAVIKRRTPYVSTYQQKVS